MAIIFLSGCVSSNRTHESGVNAGENQLVVIIVPVMAPSSDYDNLPNANDPNFLQAGLHFHGKELRPKSIK